MIHQNCELRLFGLVAFVLTLRRCFIRFYLFLSLEMYPQQVVGDCGVRMLLVPAETRLSREQQVRMCI